METLLRDLRYSLRMLAKSPGFTALAVATLALGIGANTAIFSIANSVLLRPLAYKDPSHLVRVSTHPTGECCLSLPYFTLLNDASRSFSGIAAYVPDAANMEGRDGAEQIEGERVTGNFFDVLGVAPLVGRTFTPTEDKPGAAPVILIGYELAHRLFGQEAKALGQHLSMNSKDYEIVGVLPPKFGLRLLGRQPEIWMTRLIDFSLVTPARVNIGGMYFESFGRLRTGATPEQARAEAALVFQQYKQDKPGNFDASSDVTITVGDLQSNLVSDARPTLLILSAAVGCVLLIACANVAGLLLSRSIARRKEFALRATLGAARWTMMRQLLTESMLMAVFSGVLGILLALIRTQSLAAFTQRNLPQVTDVPIDIRVLVFTLAISVLSGIFFGLAPALQLSRSDLGIALADESRGAAGSRTRNRARTILVPVQIALSIVLLIGAGLLIRSFERLRSVSPGFDPSRTLTAQTFLPPTSYQGAPQRIAFYEEVLRRIQAIPGVESASISTALPILPTHETPARFEGQPEVELGRRPLVFIESISPDYPKTMRIPLVAGRTFEDSDGATAAPVVLVNQSLARRFWPNDSPIGKLVSVGTLAPFRVVGVLADYHNESLSTPPSPEVYFAFPQLPYPALYFTLRSTLDPHSLASTLRAQISSVNRAQPVTDVQTMDERLDSGSAPTRSMMLLIGVFSATALILAVVAIYGVIAYSVAQRTQELGIRMALGASNGDIFGLVIGNGLRLALGGILVGLVAAFALTRLMASLLFQTSATDPITFIGSAAIFAAVAVLASYVPARRATRISPTDALRAG
jgi:putative ABC transport system permease protein